ncbi:MAG: hypothetical protein HBSAPP03_04620 [Phycisphaerae bacterium]|nr:MAG: hypothetical protein HBSAPP03_04620 [Phycisphaerae bacterium]
MRYRVRCEDRNTGRGYVIEQEGRSPQAALSLAMMAGHNALGLADDQTAPRVGSSVAAATPARAAADGKAITSMILSCLALVLCCVPPLSVPLALLGLVFGVFAPSGSGVRAAGIVIGVVALVLSGFAVVAWIALSPTLRP